MLEVSPEQSTFQFTITTNNGAAVSKRSNVFVWFVLRSIEKETGTSLWLFGGQ